MVTADRCPDCGFSPEGWTADDVAGTFRSLSPWWDELVKPLPHPIPPQVEAHGRRLADEAGDGDHLARDAAEAKGDRSAVAALAARLHDPLHELSAAGRTVHDLGLGMDGGPGSVAQINVSSGGVPKLPVGSADVDFGGVIGDRQAARKHHGRPWQALCLWSAEVIERLRGEGHPIAPGLAGENLTLSGIDWTAVRPGVRLGIGPDVLVELSLWALPCSKNAGWFVDGDFRRMEHTRERGVSRVYATVLRGGRVRTGDRVTVEPPG